MAISPDGSRLVFSAYGADGVSRLWVRRFDSVTPRALGATDGGSSPFWSPDSASIAFFAQGKVKRIDEAGGAPQILCESSAFASFGGGSWNRDGTIIFSALDGPIRRVADTGGPSIPVTAVDASRRERNHAWPVFLPDGRRFLFLARSNDREQTGIYQGSLDSLQTRLVLAAESRPALAGRHLLVVSNHTLIAHPYDADRGRVGEPIRIAEHIESDSPLRSGGAFAAAGQVIAYRSASPDSRLIWFVRSGKELGSVGAPADYKYPWLSFDNRRLAVEKTDASTGRHTIWILELAHGQMSRLVADPAGAHGPIWASDDRRGTLMAATVTDDRARLETGEPRALFNNGMATSFDYVVTQDGQRFLLNIAVEDQNPAPITVVLNWNDRGKD